MAELQLGTSPLIHTHQISDIDGLQTSLSNKASVFHEHSFNDIYKTFTNQDQTTTTKTLEQVLNEREADIRALIGGKANTSHGHQATEIEYKENQSVKQELDRINSRMSKTNAAGVAVDLFDIIFGTGIDIGLQAEVSTLQSSVAALQGQVASLGALQGIYGVNNTTNGIMEVADEISDFSDVVSDSRTWVDSLSDWFSSLRSHITSQTNAYTQLVNDYSSPALSSVSNESALYIL